VAFELGGDITKDMAGNQEWGIWPNIELRPSSRLHISLGPSYNRNHNLFQWVTSIEDETATITYGKRYIFATMDQHTISMSTRINWTFTPKLSFQLYMQPFFSVGEYKNLKELAKPRSYDFNIYGQNGSTIDFADETYTIDPDGTGPADEFSISDPNFNFKSLRGTALIRWEYRPGSVLYLVWTQDRTDFQNPGNFRFGRDFGDLTSAKANNIFLLKMTYWWNP
jgi:hypothetical protein